MYGEYKSFKTKFPDSYECYKIDLNNINDESTRDDIKLIPRAIELGYKVREGKSFADENVFERKIAENVFEVIWFVIAGSRTPQWKKANRIDGQYESDGLYFNSLKEALW